MKGILWERPSSFCRYSLGIREAACSCQFGRFVEIRFDDSNPAQGHRHRDLLGQLVNSYSGIADPLCIDDPARSIGYGARCGRRCVPAVLRASRRAAHQMHRRERGTADGLSRWPQSQLLPRQCRHPRARRRTSRSKLHSPVFSVVLESIPPRPTSMTCNPQSAGRHRSSMHP